MDEFYKRIPFKFSEKNQPSNLASKIPARTVKFGTIFEKSYYQCDFENSHETLQLVENIKPTKNLFCTNLYMFI